jgi:hypothetical protein
MTFWLVRILYMEDSCCSSVLVIEFSFNKHHHHQGQGAFNLSMIRAAEILIKSQMASAPPTSLEEATRDHDQNLSLSPVAVRTLYSLQLEMDAILPVKITAQCRIWADEKLQVALCSPFLYPLTPSYLKLGLYILSICIENRTPL